MTGTCGADHHIAGAADTLGAVIIVKDLALDHIEQFALVFVHMEANTAAGLQRDIGKQTALVVQFFRGREAGDLHDAIAATHLFIVHLLAVCCFSDHSNDLLVRFVSIIAPGFGKKQ